MMKKAVFVLLAALIIICGCNRNGPDKLPTETRAEPDMTFDPQKLSEELEKFMDNADPNDIVKVSIRIKHQPSVTLLVQLRMEEEFGISHLLLNSVEERNSAKVGELAKARYEYYHNYEGAPSYEDNKEEAKLELYQAYNKMKEKMREDYYQEVIDSIPFRSKVDLEWNSRLISDYVATAAEICELSRNEWIELMEPEAPDPADPPTIVRSAVTYTEMFDELEVSVSFDRGVYTLGETVNIQIMLRNTGDDHVTLSPVTYTGRNGIGGEGMINGMYYINCGFYEDGTLRSDISCDYGRYGMSDNSSGPGDTLLYAGETMSKTYSFTPHMSYEFGREAVDDTVDWDIKTSFAVVEEDEPVICNMTVPVPHLSP